MPESQPDASDVDVWATESVFVHVTVVPASTVRSSGAKADVPSTEAPPGIVTDEDGPLEAADVAGAGAGVVDAGVVGLADDE